MNKLNSRFTTQNKITTLVIALILSAGIYFTAQRYVAQNDVTVTTKTGGISKSQTVSKARWDKISAQATLDTEKDARLKSQKR